MGAILTDLKLVETGTEPVTVAEVKAYLQIEGSGYDAPLGIFITAARQMIERKCGVSLIDKAAIATINNSGYKPFKLPYYPVESIDEVKWRKCPSEWVELTAGEDYNTIGDSNVEIESSETGLHRIAYTLVSDTSGLFKQATIAQAGYMFTNRDGDRKADMAPEVSMLLQGSTFIG